MADQYVGSCQGDQWDYGIQGQTSKGFVGQSTVCVMKSQEAGGQLQIYYSDVLRDSKTIFH